MHLWCEHMSTYVEASDQPWMTFLRSHPQFSERVSHWPGPHGLSGAGQLVSSRDPLVSFSSVLDFKHILNKTKQINSQ